MRHLPKHQRVWVGVCVAATLPFFVRDLGQLGETPPILREPLAPSAIAHYSTIDEARIGSKVDLRLEEVRTVVGGGGPAWKPYALILPETPPSGQTLHGDTVDRQLLPLDETLYRFSVSWTSKADITAPVLIRSTPGTNGEEYIRFKYHSDSLHGRRAVNTWRAFPKGTRTASIDAGFAFANETRTLAQFPIPGSLGISYGAKAAWITSNDAYFNPVKIELPDNLRPQKPGTYSIQTYTINRWGVNTLAETNTVDLLPDSDSLHLFLPSRPESRDAQAVRVTITPYHWARFADVPLTIPGGDAERVNAIPITPSTDQTWRMIRQGGTGATGDYHELFRLQSDGLTNAQLAQFVPNSVVLTHTQQTLDSVSSSFSRTESYFYAFVPTSWESAKRQVTLYAITQSGKRIKATPLDGVKEDNGIRLGFILSGIPYEDVAEVSFGLTQ